MVKKKTNKKSVIAKAADAVKKVAKKAEPKASNCMNCNCMEAGCGCDCCEDPQYRIKE